MKRTLNPNVYISAGYRAEPEHRIVYPFATSPTNQLKMSESDIPMKVMEKIIMSANKKVQFSHQELNRFAVV